MQRLAKWVMALTVTGFLLQVPSPADAQKAVKIKQGVLKNATGVVKTAPSDLIVSKINYSPGKPSAGDEITMWVFVKNIGPGRAGASGARIKVGGDSNPPVVPVPALNPGKEWRYTKKFTMNRPSNYIVTITADARNEQSETNEANNSKSTRITVTPPPKSDLVVSKISYSPEAPKSYDRVTVQYFVKNIGKGKSGQCALRMTRKSSLGQIAVDVTQVPELAPGQEWLNTQPYFLITGGRTFTFKGIVDDSNRVDESNENNNERVKEMQVH